MLINEARDLIFEWSKSTVIWNCCSGYHEREVFPSHSEMVVMVNDKESRFTGTSGTIACELQEENVHLIVMWSIPYNLRVYNSYFGIGVVQLSTR